MLSVETVRLLSDLSAALDDGTDLNADLARIAAGWRAAVGAGITVSLAAYHDDGSTALVLTDAPVERTPGDVASSVSIPLVAAGGLTIVLRLNATAPLDFDWA